ncbi:hypothetical protein AMJ83_09770 [candidate division WOR_3 bacterium SM23_42]|uniref:Secretion system C-terminal sorting domain-containing protein n=1 Tax=candidate division WOR_3 bacterium SM23_42 TaxID=1703779 RepID=A0A0S8FQ26_UNCW3|nr:MAG: hypothetical protein AMJ83_09770 [candidate division WOR_3 bacterium SM23_42]
MKCQRFIETLGVSCLVVLTLPCIGAAELIHGSADPVEAWNSGHYFVEEGPIRQATLYTDGSVHQLPTLIVTWPVTNSDMTNVSFDDFRRMVMTSREAFGNDPNKIVVSGEISRNGLNIVFNVSSPPPGVTAALESVATYIENVFSDSATVTINMNFQPLGPGILGMASSSMAPVPSWTDARNCLINDMDDDDSMQLWLPSGNTIPVRYEYTLPTITNEDRCWFRVATYNAAIGYCPGVAAQITFNSTITWDCDPSDGITGYCFQSVTAHEIGHVLGFGCGAWMNFDIEALDIYRFQFSDSIFDYNPDDLYEFQTTARMVDESPGDNDVISDLISVEYRMSDGSPYQCSHFMQNAVNAIMQPAIGSSQTYYPCFYRAPDRIMFDAIGWDYLLSYFLATRTHLGSGTIERNPDSSWYSPGTEIELTAVPDVGWEFVNWLGDLSGSDNPDTIIMDDDKTVLAYFQTANCTLTIYTDGNGSVIRNPALPYYPSGSAVELTAVPDTGWEFSHWSGNLWGSQNPDTIIMNNDKTVTAHFTQMGIEEISGDLVAVTSLEVFPNPFSDFTDIRYQISDNSREATLKIIDISGRIVKLLNIPSSDIGHQLSVSWDGRDYTGRKVPTGVYFVKLETTDEKITKPILLLK